MTRAELRQFVRDLTLTEPHEVSDALIDVFLQEGYFKTVSRSYWGWLRQPPETFAAASNPYDMSNFLVNPVLAISDLAPAEGTRLPLTQITRSEHTYFLRTRPIGQVTQFYWVEGPLIYFDPEPSVDQMFICSYYADPGWPVDDIEVPPFPEAFHSVILGNYATHRVWERQEDFDRSDAYMGRFEVAMAEMQAQENMSNRDRPKVFGELVGTRGRARNMPWLDGV